MKKYGRNWWITKGKTKHWFCPLCGKEPETVLRGKHKLSYITSEHCQILYFECNHKDINPDNKYGFPTKFKIEEMTRFPRQIGELKDNPKGKANGNDKY